MQSRIQEPHARHDHGPRGGARRTAMNPVSRRKLITAGLAAGAGATGLAVVARLADRYGLVPPDHGGLYGAGATLTYAAQKLLTGHALAREFPRTQISKAPFAKFRPFKNAAFDRLRAEGFAAWRVDVDGMVARPGSFSLAELRGFPSRSQITALTCEEGWSFIAEWIGVPLSHILGMAEVLPEARYVVYQSIQGNSRQSIDMTDALHPQTLLIYGMNGGDLPVGHGGPVRMRVPRQLGYKNLKFVNRITLADNLKPFLRKSSYAWYAGI
jgi:DMSO/TMAO reductase YedYZ molybdopterin-dependent catalytic subunit